MGLTGRFFRSLATRRLVAAAVVVACSGCALTDVEVAYPGPTEGPKLKVGSGREIVLRLPFADQRKIRERCGMKKNTYNIDTADVICPPPAPSFSHVLAEELRARGFLVTTAGNSASADPLVIEGAVQKLLIDEIVSGILQPIYHFPALGRVPEQELAIRTTSSEPK